MPRCEEPHTQSVDEVFTTAALHPLGHTLPPTKPPRDRLRDKPTNILAHSLTHTHTHTHTHTSHAATRKGHAYKAAKQEHGWKERGHITKVHFVLARAAWHEGGGGGRTPGAAAAILSTLKLALLLTRVIRTERHLEKTCKKRPILPCAASLWPCFCRPLECRRGHGSTAWAWGVFDQPDVTL
jgi:hypothetical protein